MGPAPGAIRLGYNPYAVGGAPSYAWYYSSGGRTVWGGSGPAAEAAPATPAPVPEAAAAATGGAISSTTIPISWGQRRIVGKVVDHIAKALGADGVGAEILCISAGQPLFREVPNNLVKIVANGTTVYDITLGGVIHPGLTSVVWYDGTSDAQIQDPTFVAEFGADVTPGYVGQMIAILDFNSYAAWNGGRPAITIFIADAAGGSLFSPWTGRLDNAAKDPEVVLSGGDLHAKNNGTGFGCQGSVLGTVSHATGRWCLEFQQVTAGSRIGLAKATSHLSEFVGSQDPFSFGLQPDGTFYICGVFGGFVMSYTTADRVQLLADLTARKVWFTKGSGIYYGAAGTALTAADVVAGSVGVDISHVNLAGELFPIVGMSNNNGLGGVFDEADAMFDQSAFLHGVIGEIGLRNWGDVFVELAPIAHLDADHIVTIDITETSEGGVIYGGFSWTDFVTNAGKISNIDWWEDGQNINIKQTAFDDPPNDVDGIPVAHRYVRDEDKGATEADRGGERRKPVVYELSYYDVSRQFQQSMVPARSEAHESVTVAKLSVPFVMTAEAAATRSAIALGKSEMEMEEHSLSLPPIVPYFRLRPVDIVEFDEETRGIRTKVQSWLLDSDWGVEIKLQKLFTTSADPTVPLELETIAASLPLAIPWRMDFSDSRNSGYAAAISGQ